MCRSATAHWREPSTGSAAFGGRYGKERDQQCSLARQPPQGKILPSNPIPDLNSRDTMPDPLSAISLASSIVQFVDFTIKLVTDGYELYDKGALAHDDELRLVTRDLTQLTKSFANSSSFATGLAGTPRSDHSGITSGVDSEESLYLLASSCHKLGDELLSIIESLSPQKARSGLESFRLSLKSRLKRKRINDIEERLGRYQRQLVMNLTSVLQ
jgi:hypothetical protein